jgi:ribonuclease R
MEAERETLAIKQAEFLSRQLGEVYDGVISGMLGFGFFVRILDVGAEGLVRLSMLEDDYYTADLEKFVVVGRRTGRAFRLGDRIKVQIIKVSLESGEIDLQLVEDSKPRKKQPRQPRTRRRK